MLILAMPGNTALANELAAHIGQRGPQPAGAGSALVAEAAEVVAHRFPDGETLVRIDAPVQGRTVVLACTLDHPDDKTLPLLFAADAARELGATRVGLVAPYLAYMRQDHRFRPGEAITSRSFARLVSASFDFLVTVDPHLHRWHSLDEIYTLRSRVVPAAPAIAAWVRENVARPLLVGPDSESAQWVEQVARLAQAPWTVMAKTRRGDRDVSVVLDAPDDAAGRTPVLVDDIISTGHTLMAAAQALQEAGLGQPLCIGVHALFDEAAHERMRAAGIARVLTCDCIAHATNAIAVAPALAAAVAAMAGAG